MSGNKTGVRAAMDAAEMDAQAHAVGGSDSERQLDLLSEEAIDDDQKSRVFSGGSRGPGRPKGSTNKKTQAMKAYLDARGYKDPLVFLADMVSADPIELLAWFREQKGGGDTTLLDIVKLQASAAKELGPYLHGKMPIEVNVADERLPMLIMDLGTNQLAEARANSDDQAMSIGFQMDDEANDESE